MARAQNPAEEASTVLAQNLVQALLRERVIPRFVDSYVVDNGRHALQVHASLYRDLLTILQREALLAACVRALEFASTETIGSATGKQRVVVRKGAEVFRRKFLSALARQQNWNAGDALDFQSDLRMYEDLVGKGAGFHGPRLFYGGGRGRLLDARSLPQAPHLPPLTQPPDSTSAEPQPRRFVIPSG